MVRAEMEAGRRLVLPRGRGVEGWLAVCCWLREDETKSVARRLRRFLIGAYRGGGINLSARE